MTDAYDLYQQGRNHLQGGMAAQATVALEKAKKLEPDKASIREALGIAYFRIQRWSEAEAEFRAVLELSPTDDYRPLRARPHAREAGPGCGGERALQARKLALAAERALRRADHGAGRAGAGLKVVLQRVSRASVSVAGEVRGEIGAGLLVLLGVESADGVAEADRLAGKVARLRVFEDDSGRFDRSLLDTGGAALVVSQFTLLADTAKGNRPSFSGRRCIRARGARVRALLRCPPRPRRPRRDGRVRRADAGRARQRRPGHDRPRVSSAALALALGAALLHALWNLLLGGSRDVLARDRGRARLEPGPRGAGGGRDLGRRARGGAVARRVRALELVYFFALAAAYQRADVSLVYPIARGGAPVLVLAWTLAFGAELGASEVAGVLAVAVGVVLVRGFGHGDRVGVAFGVVIALLIAAYTLVDAEGIEFAIPCHTCC